ncbi:hypothetical protein AAFA46_06765 [Oscillospiraceae bacterium WX1]
MGSEETFKKALLKMLSAIRALKMMAGRFDGDSDDVNNNDDNHHGDNIYIFWHKTFLLETLDFFLRVDQIRDQRGDNQEDQPDQNTA